MVITNEFSIALPLDIKEVLPVLSDLQLHLGLCHIIESIAEVLSDNEVVANLKMGDYLGKMRFRISTSKEDETNVVIIEGRNDLSLELRLGIVGRKVLGNPLTLVKGKVTVKSANEKALKPHVKEFVEAYQKRLIDALPAIIDAWKRGLIKKVERKAEIVTKPPEKAVHEELVKREELPKPKPVLSGVRLAENPVALEDETSLSNIILKSQILRTLKEEISGSELLRKLNEAYLETKLKTLYMLAVDAETNKARMLIREGVIVGVRFESKEGAVVNGMEAVKKLEGMGKRTWRITIYSVTG